MNRSSTRLRALWSDGVFLTSRTNAFEELVDFVAAESIAETNRRRQRPLDEACAALEAAFAVE